VLDERDCARPFGAATRCSRTASRTTALDVAATRLTTHPSSPPSGRRGMVDRTTRSIPVSTRMRGRRDRRIASGPVRRASVAGRIPSRSSGPLRSAAERAPVRRPVSAVVCRRRLPWL